MNLDSIGGMFIGIACCIAAIAIPLSIYHTQVTKAAMAAGLVQGTIPGVSGVYWVKPGAVTATAATVEYHP